MKLLFILLTLLLSIDLFAVKNTTAQQMKSYKYTIGSDIKYSVNKRDCEKIYAIWKEIDSSYACYNKDMNVILRPAYQIKKMKRIEQKNSRRGKVSSFKKKGINKIWDWKKEGKKADFYPIYQELGGLEYGSENPYTLVLNNGFGFGLGNKDYILTVSKQSCNEVKGKWSNNYCLKADYPVIVSKANYKKKKNDYFNNLAAAKKLKDKQANDRLKRQKDAPVYAGIKMYSYISENKTLNNKDNFTYAGLHGYAHTNSKKEIDLITMRSQEELDNKKTIAVEKQFRKKYKFVSSEKVKSVILKSDIKDIIRKRYISSGSATAIDLKRALNKVRTNKIELGEILVFTNNGDKVILARVKQKYNGEITYSFSIEYISNQYLKKMNSDNNKVNKQIEKQNKEITGL